MTATSRRSLATAVAAIALIVTACGPAATLAPAPAPSSDTPAVTPETSETPAVTPAPPRQSANPTEAPPTAPPAAETPTPTPAAPVEAQWVTAGKPSVARSFANLVALPGGRALLVGDDNPGLPGDGAAGNTRQAEVWNRTTNRWTRTASLNAPRGRFVALPLRDGRVLVTGGISDWTAAHVAQAYSSTKIWDPATGKWSNGALLTTAREAPFGVVLADGRVMVGGGTFVNGEKYRSLTTVEIYDPGTGAWSKSGALHHPLESGVVTPSGGPPAVTLADGRVLVVGSWFEETGADGEGTTHAAAEIWDPATGRWTELTGLPALLGYEGYSLVALADGGALLIGGVTYDNDSVLHADVARLDGRTLAWQVAAPLPRPRAFASAVRLADGRVLLTGGQTAFAPISGSVEAINRGDPSTLLFEPATGEWTEGPAAPVGRVDAPIALLDDGSVLTVVGGTQQCRDCVPSPWVNDNEAAARFIPGSP